MMSFRIGNIAYKRIWQIIYIFYDIKYFLDADQFDGRHEPRNHE